MPPAAAHCPALPRSPDHHGLVVHLLKLVGHHHQELVKVLGLAAGGRSHGAACCRWEGGTTVGGERKAAGRPGAAAARSGTGIAFVSL